MKRWKNLLAGILVFGVLSGCGTQGERPAPPPSAVETPPTPVQSQTVVETLKLTREEFPRLDGSTSTAPLAQAVCAVLLGEEREAVADLVSFSRTTQSYRNLMWRNVDLLIAAEPAESVVEENEDYGFPWEMAPIATDALVFLVNEDNPVDNLTIEQVQKIYTGEITNWKQVGGEDRPILPFQRNEEAGSQTLMKKLVMGDIEMMEPEKEYLVASMAGLIEAVRSFDGSPGAIGYTVYYYANDMNMAEGLKVVSIGGAAPDAATIRSGEYPFTNPYYTAIAADAPADSPARQVFEWLQGPIGQSLIQHEGYVSILDDPAPIEWDLGETEPVVEKYTRLSQGAMPELIPSDDYGKLFSYMGYTIDSQWGGYYGKYGLMTREGMMVTDPVYDNVGRVSYFDGNRIQSMDILYLTRTMGESAEEMEEYVALAAENGSWVTDFNWLYVGGVAPDRLWAVLSNGDGVMMDLSLKELWRLPLEEGQELWRYQGGVDGSMWWLNGAGIVYGTNGSFVVDLDGKMVASQEKGIVDVQGFYEGLSAAHSVDNWDTWGYINNKGEWVIKPAYRTTSNFCKGKAIVSKEGVSQIIDAEGNVLLETDGEFQHHTGVHGDWYLEYIRLDTFDYWITGAYDENLQSLDWDWIGSGAAWGGENHLWRITENGGEMGNPYETVSFPVGENIELHIQEGEVVTFSHWGDQTTNPLSWSVWSMDGECIFPEKKCAYLSVLEDSETSEVYICEEQGRKNLIYDKDGNFLMECAGWPTISDGLISVKSDLSYGYKTMDGEWVFRISLMKSQED